MKHLLFSLIVCIMIFACADDGQLAPNVRRLDIRFAEDAASTRSYWVDQTNDQHKQVARYVWDTEGNNMLTTIRHEGRYVPFFASLASTSTPYSLTAFQTVDDAQSKIQLHTLQGVRYEVTDNQWVSPVAAGDEMYCFYPLHEGEAASTTLHATQDAVSVDMRLPNTFTYSQLQNNLQGLSPYAYVYTSTTLKEVNDNAVVAQGSHFQSACAIIRFNVTNRISSDIQITGIRMEADDESGIFPNMLCYADGQVTEQADKTGYYSQLNTRMEPAVTMPTSSTGCFYNLCFPLLQGDFNHVPLKFTIDTDCLTYQFELDSDEINGHKFEAGKLYEFSFDLVEREDRAVHHRSGPVHYLQY